MMFAALTAGAQTVNKTYATTGLAEVPANTSTTFYLYNVGQQKFLASDAATGTLRLDSKVSPNSVTASKAGGTLTTLGDNEDAVAAAATATTNLAGYYYLGDNGSRLSCSLHAMPTADSKGLYWQWLVKPTTRTVTADDQRTYYTVGNRNREASATYYLYYDQTLGQVSTTPYRPAAEFTDGQWVLVEQDNMTMSVTFDESADSYNAALATVPAGVSANVTLNRTLYANEWNSFVAPFTIDNPSLSTQLADKGFTNLSVAQLTGAQDQVLQFASTTEALAAADPYIVYFDGTGTDGATTLASLTATIAGPYEFAAAPKTLTKAETGSTGDSVKACGIFFKSTPATTGNATTGGAPQGSYILSGNKLFQLKRNYTIQGFRGWFTEVSANAAAKGLTGWTLDDGPTTSIDAIDAKPAADGPAYNLRGQRVNASRLPQGVYIIGGKKVVR